jgi:hypothetical protein
MLSENDFRKIKGFEEYGISPNGVIKRLNTQKILRPFKNCNGYLIATFYVRGAGRCRKKYSHVSVHRLVAEAYLGLDRDDKKVLVCHKNDTPTDNRVENLFLGTHKDNFADMRQKGRSARGVKNTKAKLSESDVRVIRKIRGETQDAIAKKFGVTHSTISKIRLGITWNHI